MSRKQEVREGREGGKRAQTVAGGGKKKMEAGEREVERAKRTRGKGLVVGSGSTTERRENVYCYPSWGPISIAPYTLPGEDS